MLGSLLREGLCLGIGLQFFGLLHFSEFIDEFLDEGDVEALGEKLKYFLEHMKERRRKPFEL